MRGQLTRAGACGLENGGLAALCAANRPFTLRACGEWMVGVRRAVGGGDFGRCIAAERRRARSNPTTRAECTARRVPSA
jgi:hypothetical protein